MPVRSRVLSRSRAAASFAAASLVLGVAPAAAGNPYPLTDFDGDGHGDLAIGAPRENVNGINDAGAVHVLYGTANGLSSARDQRWHQGRLAAIDGAKLEPGDRFGTALAAADYNGDGFTDLAIGVPGEDHDGSPTGSLATQANAGAVHILFGSPGGLTAAGALIILNPLSHTHPDLAGERFGAALAAMHRYRELPSPPNGPDPFVDLAVGAPGGASVRGRVTTFSMDADGLGGRQSVFTCPDGGPGDGCGSVLAAGHLTEHPFDGLAIGAPAATVDGLVGAGLITLVLPEPDPNGGFRYRAANSAAAGDLPNLDDQAGAAFGAALAIENVAGNTVKELFIGAPGYDVEVGDTIVTDAGIVAMSVGTDDGPGNLVAIISEADDDIADGAEPGDRFGTAITIGFFGAGYAVAIGVPGETVRGRTRAGAVNVYFDSEAVTDRKIHLDRAGVLGEPTANDQFGSVLGRMKLLGTVHDDLIVGVPLANVSGKADAGAVSVLPGATRLDGTGDQRWTLDSAGINGVPAAGDRLGVSVD